LLAERGNCVLRGKGTIELSPDTLQGAGKKGSCAKKLHREKTFLRLEGTKGRCTPCFERTQGWGVGQGRDGGKCPARRSDTSNKTNELGGSPG